MPDERATGDRLDHLHSAQPDHVIANVVAGGFILITSVDSGIDDLIQIDPTATIQSTGSTVTIRSGDGIWQRAGSTIQSPTQINLEVDHASTDPGVGGTAQLDGTLIAPLIVVSGNADPDTLTLHPVLVVGTCRCSAAAASTCSPST